MVQGLLVFANYPKSSQFYTFCVAFHITIMGHGRVMWPTHLKLWGLNTRTLTEVVKFYTQVSSVSIRMTFHLLKGHGYLLWSQNPFQLFFIKLQAETDRWTDKGSRHTPH